METFGRRQQAARGGVLCQEHVQVTPSANYCTAREGLPLLCWHTVNRQQLQRRWQMRWREDSQSQWRQSLTAGDSHSRRQSLKAGDSHSKRETITHSGNLRALMPKGMKTMSTMNATAENAYRSASHHPAHRSAALSTPPSDPAGETCIDPLSASGAH